MNYLISSATLSLAFVTSLIVPCKSARAAQNGASEPERNPAAATRTQTSVTSEGALPPPSSNSGGKASADSNSDAHATPEPPTSASASAAGNAHVTPEPAPVAPPPAPAAASPASAAPPGAVVVAAPDQPLAAYFDVGFVVQVNWNKDRSYDFFSDNDVLPKGGLVLGADVARFDAAILAVDLNALFTSTTTSGPLPNYVFDAELKQAELGGGVTVRYEVLSWLAPQARVGGGVALQNTLLSTADFGDLQQDFTTGYLTLGGGLAFTTPAHRTSRTRTWFNSLALRVIVEGGYQLASELDFVVKGSSANTSTPNAIADTRLGALQQSGPYLRVSVQARF